MVGHEISADNIVSLPYKRAVALKIPNMIPKMRVFIYNFLMPKKRKSNGNKRFSSSPVSPLALALLAASAAFYFYGASSESASQADERKPVAETVGLSGEAQNFRKTVRLPEKLEIPVCEGMAEGEDHEIRNFAHYTICYRESYEQAEWSAYCLTEERLVKNAGRSNDFRPDPEISTDSASLADYKNSGYDRGHLSPAADFAFDEDAMSETFYMSNMSPQAGPFNRGIWKSLESQVRAWAKRFGRVYVVSGPVLEKKADEYGAIGENKVAVPEFYYKVILAPLYADESDRATPEDSESVIAAGYILPNKKCSGSLEEYAVSVDEIEERTKLDFFSLLEDDIESEIEKHRGGL